MKAHPRQLHPLPIRMVVLLTVAALGGQCVPMKTVNQPSNEKNIVLNDAIYEKRIKSVLLHPSTNTADKVIAPPVIHIAQQAPLVLSFDDLNTRQENYYVYIIPCNAMWQRSNLLNAEFLKMSNTFPITAFKYYVNTTPPYIHYTFEVPKVGVPGNYVLVAYQNLNKKDALFSLRFMVFNRETRIEHTLTPPFNHPHEREKKQQVRISVHYKGLNPPNPLKNFTVIIRQNQQWDRILILNRPNQMSHRESVLSYQPIDGNTFYAPRNFRSFHTGVPNLRGKNVAKVQVLPEKKTVILNADKIRRSLSYVPMNDINGNYMPSTADPTAFTADYVYVTFTLKEPPLFEKEIYVMGRFNLWRRTEENKMKYDEEKKWYTTTILLQQGYYDYMYYVDKDPCEIEGCFFQSNNEYEIFVYYRDPLRINRDILTGYKHFVEGI